MMGFDTVEFLAMGAGVLFLLLLCTFLVLLASAVTSFGFVPLASMGLMHFFVQLAVGHRSIC